MEYKIDKNGDVKVPADLFCDMAHTWAMLSNRFNCNDGFLEDQGLDWWYWHKMRRRIEYIMNNIEK